MKKEIILSLLFIILLSSITYYFISLIGILSEPIQLYKIQNLSIKMIKTNSHETLLYYPNMKFNHNVITYNFDNSCNEEKKGRMKKAMLILQEKVKNIIFVETKTNDSDIKISCKEEELPIENKKYFIQGEGGPTSLINTSLFFVIEKGIIFLFYEKTICKEPIVELHELLHVFGFKHSEDKSSIMYPVLNCNQVLKDDIVNKLNQLYSIENLPDLYFDNINVYKKGIFINFDVEVKNRGLTDAKNVEIVIYSMPKQKIIDKFNLGTISYGGGKFLKVENLRIPISTKYIKFEIIDGKELYKENNVVEFSIK